MPNHEILFGKFGKPLHQKNISDNDDPIELLDDNDDIDEES